MGEILMNFIDVLKEDATKDIPKCQTGISDTNSISLKDIPIIDVPISQCTTSYVEICIWVSNNKCLLCGEKLFQMGKTIIRSTSTPQDLRFVTTLIRFRRFACSPLSVLNESCLPVCKDEWSGRF
jgi:hypothetical protein